MQVSDKKYRNLLCNRLRDLVLENLDLISEETLHEIDGWCLAFEENSSEDIFEVNLEMIDAFSIDLLKKFKNSFSTLRDKAINDLGKWYFIQRMIHWREHLEMNTILSDLDNLILELEENSDTRAAS